MHQPSVKPLERYSTEEKDHQNKVGEGGCDVDNLGKWNQELSFLQNHTLLLEMSQVIVVLENKTKKTQAINKKTSPTLFSSTKIIY